MQKFIRKIQKNGTHSYTINIPKELMDEFKWCEHQKVVIIFGGRKAELVIRDWQKRQVISS